MYDKVISRAMSTIKNDPELKAAVDEQYEVGLYDEEENVIITVELEIDSRGKRNLKVKLIEETHVIKKESV